MKLLANMKTRRWIKRMPGRMSSAAMILENTIGQVLIVKANYKPYWTFPGGIIDPHETPRQGAIRETFEEVGIRVSESKVEFVAVIDRRSSFAETYQFIFRAPLKIDIVNGIILQASEIDDYALVTRQQVKSGDRIYGKAVEDWAHGKTGYLEQVFGAKVHA